MDGLTVLCCLVSILSKCLSPLSRGINEYWPIIVNGQPGKDDVGSDEEGRRGGGVVCD